MSVSLLSEKAEAARAANNESSDLSGRSNAALYQAIAAAIGWVHLSRSREHFDEARKEFAKRNIEPKTNSNIYLPVATLLFWDGTGQKPSTLYKYAKAIRACVDAEKSEEAVVEFIQNFKMGKRTALDAIYAYDSERYPTNRGSPSTDSAVVVVKQAIAQEEYGKISRPLGKIAEVQSLCILAGEITGSDIVVRSIYTGEDEALVAMLKNFKPDKQQKASASLWDDLGKIVATEPALKEPT